MGGLLCSFSDRSYNPKITKSIKLRRELCRLTNHYLEQEDLFIDLCVKIEKKENEIRKKKLRKLRHERNKKRAANRAKQQEILARRHEKLMKVIEKGIRVNELEAQRAKLAERLDKMWSLVYEIDPTEMQRDWKESLRRTRSESDINKAVPSFPLVQPSNEPAIWLTADTGAQEMELDTNIVSSPSIERLMRLNLMNM
ncbi:uncharacterized protein LOC5504386 isoform X2 [Nematostella vectensis]|uniref:uncharacterized protein LOC5504386 isoform X2 n=1 Tax=Nematostella vectensis TaxID=45351 RepID=UPI0020771AD2|nr:uncharacterized protein LOC5504386 isoform X2 [Nematostella vectensis]